MKQKLEDALKKVRGTETKITKNDEGVVIKIKSITDVILEDGSIIQGVGVAKVHPDDIDMATEKAGTHISYLRSIIGVVEEIFVLGLVPKEEVDSVKKDLESEIKAYIDRKEVMYQKIRARRTGDMSNRVRTFYKSDDNSIVFETTDMKIGE